MPLVSLPASWSNRTLSQLRRNLLNWFDRHQRVLPWRASRDPYRIWVSEVMLQQTTVAAVIPYFERFLKAFPTVHVLAAADEQDVLKLWEGLGYYRRARHLHAAAMSLVADHAGQFPNDLEVWANLPGVGRYILGAVLSQAFERKLPIVEANSLRVLARLFGYRGDPREGEGKVWVWQAAERVLPNRRIGDFNQAMMELGATVCTPTSPDCGRCPLAVICVANRQGLQTVIPPPKKPPTLVSVREVAVVIRQRDRVLVCLRPAHSSRWANLWEFPHAVMNEGESVDDAAERIAKELTGLSIAVAEELLTVKHGVTRFAIAMTAMTATSRSGTLASAFYAECRWVRPSELAGFPTSTPQRKLFQEVLNGRQKRLF